jgi:hypothetical protein
MKSNLAKEEARILKNIESGAKETSLFLKGKLELKNVDELLKEFGVFENTKKIRNKKHRNNE